MHMPGDTAESISALVKIKSDRLAFGPGSDRLSGYIGEAGKTFGFGRANSARPKNSARPNEVPLDRLLRSGSPVSTVAG